MKKKWAGAVGLGAAAALVVPGVAHGADTVGDPGLQTDQTVLDYLQDEHGDDGPIPVQFWAEGNDSCEVTFTVVNRTNSNSYLVDFVVDDEDPSAIEDDEPHPTWDFGAIHKGPYDGTEIGERTLGRKGVYPEPSGGTDWHDSGSLFADGEPTTTTKTIDLHELKDLPNPDADAHTITYQQIGGPDHGFWGVQSDMPVFTTEVTGCADAGPLASLGSIDLFGSLGTGSTQ